MAIDGTIQQLRAAFQIPDSVLILRGAALRLPTRNTPAVHGSYSIDQTVGIDEELYRSDLGTPVYACIEIEAAEYETSTPGVFNQFGPMRMAAVLITVSQAKRIIKTEIQGRNGTVKEYIGDDDYAVTINGIITGVNGHYPIEDVKSLKKILDAPVAIGIASTFLQNLGIKSVVVESYDIEQKEGGYSYQTFSISCISDVPQELQLSNT